MIEEKKSHEMHSKATVEDDEQVFITAAATDEISTSSKATAKYINTANFEQSIQRLVFNKVVTDKTDIDEDLTNLLAEFLGIRDHETNLISSWILRTIAEQIINASNEINKRDYATFVQWLYEEFNIIFDNPEMQREQFFKLMNNIFHQTLSEILNGKGVLLPSQFLYLETEIEEEFTESSSSARESDKKSFSSTANNELEQLEEKTAFQQKNLELLNLDEQLLHTIIESTYQVFGTELNYMLIQAAYQNQRNVNYYTIPYHFRKPRIIKKLEASRQASVTSNPKIDKKKKRRKSSKKNSTEEMIEITKSTSFFDINQFRFILPLSEALEAKNVMHIYKNSETEKNSDVLNN